MSLSNDVMTGSLFKPYFENYEVELAVRALQRGQRIKTYLLVECLRDPKAQKIPSVLKAAADELEARDENRFSRRGQMDSDEIYSRLSTGALYELE